MFLKTELKNTVSFSGFQHKAVDYTVFTRRDFHLLIFCLARTLSTATLGTILRRDVEAHIDFPGRVRRYHLELN